MSHCCCKLCGLRYDDCSCKSETIKSSIPKMKSLLKPRDKLPIYISVESSVWTDDELNEMMTFMKDTVGKYEVRFLV